jgi:hypothetical protein
LVKIGAAPPGRCDLPVTTHSETLLFSSQVYP